ncbi:hypothetical protein CONLIGDRAFT_642795 [Coniochaeta ligniaria NRRL 30616]|uniref:Uncharacterized protein n=1 Tax=Coniochaeta ligniaria NRRL 30616 TaxID=1408157 RepID=A0A1J7ITC0_9PEZI|nr:hypothetical protein CONLIGDRAFT_642795 [Coniochaeta ligniaria NRRL 30616]
MGCGSSKPEYMPPAKPVDLRSAKPLTNAKPGPYVPRLESYMVERHPVDENLPGTHYRRASSIQRHVNKAPLITPDIKEIKSRKRYPKRYNNEEKTPGKPGVTHQLFTIDPSMTLYEFPAKSFPYDQQNSKGGLIGKSKQEARDMKGIRGP